jgi:hypothetical protein
MNLDLPSNAPTASFRAHPITDGNTDFGSESPANPTLQKEDPLSIKTTPLHPSLCLHRVNAGQATSGHGHFGTKP